MLDRDCIKQSELEWLVTEIEFKSIQDCSENHNFFFIDFLTPKTAIPDSLNFTRAQPCTRHGVDQCWGDWG